MAPTYRERDLTKIIISILIILIVFCKMVWRVLNCMELIVRICM